MFIFTIFATLIIYLTFCYLFIHSFMMLSGFVMYNIQIPIINTINEKINNPTRYNLIIYTIDNENNENSEDDVDDVDEVDEVDDVSTLPGFLHNENNKNSDVEVDNVNSFFPPDVSHLNKPFRANAHDGQMPLHRYAHNITNKSLEEFLVKKQQVQKLLKEIREKRQKQINNLDNKNINNILIEINNEINNLLSVAANVSNLPKKRKILMDDTVE
jgi:hypothetical protein